MGEDRLRLSRLGLIGVGAWGRRYIDTIAARQDCRIAAFARGSDRSDGGVHGAFRCDGWPQVLELVSRRELDGAIVAANPWVQCEVAEAAISRGVPLLSEKPVALSAATTANLLRQVQEKSAAVPLLIDHIHLWSPAYRELKARVAERLRAGGRIASIQAEGSNRGPFRTWSSLYDYGPHDLSMCLDLLGTAAVFQLQDARRLVGEGRPGGEIFEATFLLDDVSIGVRVGNGAEKKTRSFAVTFEDGKTLCYDDTNPHPLKLRDHGAAVTVDEGSPLNNVITQFLGEIEAGQGGLLQPAEASASLSREVRISQILDAIATRAVVPSAEEFASRGTH